MHGPGNIKRVNMLGPGPGLVKKGIHRTAVSQRLRNTALVVELIDVNCAVCFSRA
jgi:hypothetical protein